MILSFVVSDITSVNFIINQFSHILDSYEIERNPVNGKVEMLILFIPDEHKEEAEQLKELVEMYTHKK